jgi:hypothetical protein
MIRQQIDSLLKEIQNSPEAVAKKLQFLAVEEASFAEPVRGIYLLTWAPPQPGDRLKLRYAFRDDDGIAVLVSLVFSRDSVLTEMEFSRGDGQPIRHIPKMAELFSPPINQPF